MSPCTAHSSISKRRFDNTVKASGYPCRRHPCLANHRYRCSPTRVHAMSRECHTLHSATHRNVASADSTARRSFGRARDTPLLDRTEISRSIAVPTMARSMSASDLVHPPHTYSQGIARLHTKPRFIQRYSTRLAAAAYMAARRSSRCQRSLTSRHSMASCLQPRTYAAGQQLTPGTQMQSATDILPRPRRRVSVLLGHCVHVSSLTYGPIVGAHCAKLAHN